MNLFETLDNYKTTPSKEIYKIKSILKRNKSISLTRTTTFEKALDYLFKISKFGSYELDIDSFIEKIALKDYDPDNEKSNILQYRRLCEFLLNLLDDETYYENKQVFDEDEKQLWSLICNGLRLCGYMQIYDSNNQRVTKKIDPEAESVAALNKDYKDDIFDFLIAKDINQKEAALTNLSIKLEALKSQDKYIKSNREFVQLLRHKEEYLLNPKYSWFFEDDDYEENLDKLFRIFLSTISYSDSIDYINDFKQKCGGVSK